MDVSVIVPTYKPQSYLWECLDSICSQTLDRRKYEVIVVLNGCNEPFNSEIRKYINNHSGFNWNYIQCDQGGVSNARNIAIEKAAGYYITFIDDDDYISEEYLEELLLNIPLDGVSICNTIAFYDKSKKEQEGYIIAKEFQKCSTKKSVSVIDARRYFAGPVRKLIRKDAIGNRCFDVRFKNGEDSLFMFLISDRIHSVTCTKPSAIYYRRLRGDSANMHKRFIWRRLCDSSNLIKEYSKIYFSHPLKYSFRLYFFNVMGAVKTIILG